MSRLSFVFVTFCLFLLQQSIAQRNYNSYNKIGLQGAFVLFDINTDDFITTQGEGFAGGFTTRGSFRNAFDLMYGITFIGSSVSIQGTDGVTTQNIDFSIQGVQLHFLGSYNIIKHHLSLDFGPLLSVTGKMKTKREAQSDYIISGYETLKASDIENISPINFSVVGGVSAGIEALRASAQYQYGVTNMLHRLKDEGLEKTDFKGHSGTLLLGLVVYF